MTTINCFTYGSLMCADIMENVSGAVFPRQHAKLADYVRHPIRDEDYPGMIPSAGDCVEGYVYQAIDARALARLDAFEGPDYQRTEVTLRLDDGSALPAWVYVYRPELAARLLPGDWSFEGFERAGKARFEARYAGYDALPGNGSSARS